jgi:hypothetical protein
VGPDKKKEKEKGSTYGIRTQDPSDQMGDEKKKEKEKSLYGIRTWTSPTLVTSTINLAMSTQVEA